MDYSIFSQLLKLKHRAGTGLLPILLATITLLSVSAGSAFAVDNNSILIGGDYKFMTLKAGDDFRKCRRACRDDVSCRAWTFIKERVRNNDGLSFNLGPDLTIGFGGRKEIIPPQCRLKHSVGPRRANDCCTSGVKRVVARPRPSKAERCTTYAESAIDQQDKNLSQRCRFRGNRWSGNYRLHYRWCMKTNRRRADRETSARDDKLRSCRSGGFANDRRCDRFASTGVDLNQTARDNNCRATGILWRKDYDGLYDWCVSKPRSRVDNELAKAQDVLSSCIKRGGGPRIERCETYADEALEAVAKARKNSCGFRGSLWRNSYKIQYRFCTKNRRRAVRRAADNRRTRLDRCVSRSEEKRVMETGRVDVRQRNKKQWHTVRYSKRFRDPVVIMGPVSFNGGQPAHARVRNVTSRGFEFRIEEFANDGAHVREVLSYMVVEKGVHKFDGMIVEAGVTSTAADLVKRNWAPVRFSNSWRRAPVVLSQSQTFHGPDPMSVRIKDVTRRGFVLNLSEQESDRRGHAREKVAYVAITRGRHIIEGGSDSTASLWAGQPTRVDHGWRRIDFPRRFTSGAPALFAKAQSSKGGDTFDIRYRRLNQRGVALRLQEEKSRDSETKHVKEVMGVVALPYGSYWSASSRPVSDQSSVDPVVPPVGGGIDIANCNEYASKAVKQQRRSRRLSCGFSGPQWHNNNRRHRRWCRNNGLRSATRKLENHAGKLDQCEERADNGGGSTGGAERINWSRKDGRLKNVSVGADGTVWGVNAGNRVFERRRGRWKQLRGRIKQVDVGSRSEIWGVGTDDRVYRWSGRSWIEKRGRLKQISVGDDGTIWGVNSDNRIFSWNGRRWERQRGRLKHVSVGNRREIWGVNSSNRVYQWSGSRWIEMPGRLKQISVSPDGEVYGISPENRVLRWNARHNKWLRQSGSLKQISAGSDGRLWGVNSGNRIFTARATGSAGNDRPDQVPPVVEGEWVSLGCARVAFKNDRDTIHVGRDKGAFTALKLRSARGRIRVKEVKVTFGNGRTQVLPFTGILRKRSESGSLDLKGRRRFIASVEMLNKANISIFGEGRMCVYGKR